MDDPTRARLDALATDDGLLKALAASERAVPAEQVKRWQATALAMTERQLEDAMRRILRDLPDVWARHETDSRGARAGWLDWTFLRRNYDCGAAMFRELKTERGRLTRDQRECLAFLRAAGLDADVWRPSDLLSGRIARELAAVAGLRIAPPAIPVLPALPP